MNRKELLEKFHEIAVSPEKQMDKYLNEGRKVVLVAPVYTPEEIVHSMGAVPFGAWGADVQLSESKRYYPAFICSIVQSVLECGIKGVYSGASAIVIPSLCDSLKTLGENWKYGVPSIPFIPMTYPQNRKTDYAKEYTKSGYRRVIGDLEKLGLVYSDEKLKESLLVYNRHNEAMRKVTSLMAVCDIGTQQRSDVFKSAYFMMKEEHTALVEELIGILESEKKESRKTGIYTTGILADSKELLKILDENDLQIVRDDVAAESRQYRTDAPVSEDPLMDLAVKFADTDCCSVLYDVKKTRVSMVVNQAKESGAKGVLIIMTKFCDPEEFDYPLIRKACEAAGLPCAVIEVDRQMVNFEQARTVIETFKEML